MHSMQQAYLSNHYFEGYQALNASGASPASYTGLTQREALALNAAGALPACETFRWLKKPAREMHTAL